MKEKVRRVFGVFAFIFLVWGCYRLIFRLPENFEELVLKPIFWLGPTFWIVLKVEKKKLETLGLTSKNFFQSLYLGIGLGMVFALTAVLSNYFKYGELRLAGYGPGPYSFFLPLLVSLVTAFSEEVVFRGYIFNRLKEVLKEGSSANLLTAILFVLIHLPISVFVFHYTLFELLVYSLVVLLFSFGSALLFAKTGNIFSSILAHIFWSWPITLFR